MSSFSLLRSFSSETSHNTPVKKRNNKRYSFHQNQHQSVREPIEAGSMQRDKKTKTSLGRRWSSLKQYQTTTLSQQSLAAGSSSTNTSPHNAAGDVTLQKGEVKKKWEVIEHYKGALGGRETISSSLLAVSKFFFKRLWKFSIVFSYFEYLGINMYGTFMAHFVWIIVIKRVTESSRWQAGITTFNIDTKPQPGAKRTSFTSKSCTSVLDNFNSDFTSFSTRNSIIDNGQNGDTNNNFHIDCTLDGESEGSGETYGQKFSFRCLKKYLKRKIASTKFKNIQIEMLYQRYLLRMNQNNAAHIVWLLFALIFTLAIIHINFLLNRWNNELSCVNGTNIREVVNHNLTVTQDVSFNSTSLYLDVNLNATNETLNQSRPGSIESEICIDPLKSYELLGTNFIQFSLLGLCSILYTILLMCLYKQRINEIYLFHVSYAIIISLVIIDISFSITNMGK